MEIHRVYLETAREWGKGETNRVKTNANMDNAQKMEGSNKYKAQKIFVRLTERSEEFT